MKKLLLLSVTVSLSLIMFTSCFGWIDQNHEQVTKFYKEIKYNFPDKGNYFTATLKSCYGVKDASDPSVGKIYASIEIKANVGCYLSFKRLINGMFLTEYGIYPPVHYEAELNQQINMTAGQVITLNLEFPGVPSTLAKIGLINIEVEVNNTKTYSFVIYQIPYLPKTDRIVWK
ncbi:MAG TPA: hypothetical protein PK676_07120 [Bacteroidales bacterium]|nr:hypothetical protein [Bacteroidales bacterium]HQB56656.1 hypothetical protein [Bacteroidales bacterium]